jgi:tRNA-dihydrouridine synthase 2
MVARAAQWNLSVFRADGLLPTEQVVRDYLELASQYDNEFGNTKFCVLTTLHQELSTERGAAILASKDFPELYGLFGAGGMLKRPASPDEHASKRTCQREGDVELMEFPYDQRCYQGPLNPKTALLSLTKERGMPAPSYTSSERALDRRFQVCLLPYRFLYYIPHVP